MPQQHEQGELHGPYPVGQNTARPSSQGSGLAPSPYELIMLPRPGACSETSDIPVHPSALGRKGRGMAQQEACRD